MRRRTTPRFWAFMIVSMLIIFGACFAVLQQQYANTSAKLEQITAYKDQLSKEVSTLSKEMDYVQTDEYIMRAARDELGMIMPGEIRYVNSGN